MLRKHSGTVRPGGLREGLRTLADGSLYEGEVNDDGQPHGLGILMLPDDGTRYVGEFVKGVAHGQGVVTVTDGSRYEGEYVNGQPHGQGVLVMPDGRRVAVEMNNGVLVGN